MQILKGQVRYLR